MSQKFWSRFFGRAGSKTVHTSILSSCHREREREKTTTKRGWVILLLPLSRNAFSSHFSQQPKNIKCKWGEKWLVCFRSHRVSATTSIIPFFSSFLPPPPSRHSPGAYSSTQCPAVATQNWLMRTPPHRRWTETWGRSIKGRDRVTIIHVLFPTVETFFPSQKEGGK